MKLKKFSSVILSLIAAGTLFSGCSSTSKDVPKSQTAIITKLNEDEKTFNEHSVSLEENVKIPTMNLLHNYRFYPSLQKMIEDLNSKTVDELCTYRSVANYISVKNPNMEILPHSIGLTDSFCLAVRKEDTALRDEINSAIKQMTDDGTIDYIMKSYIIYLNPNDKAPVVEIPQIEGADTIKVGVTGDFPPFDLISEDGTPAGFSTKLLAEISRITNKNIEIVKVTADGRVAALKSKKIDVVFWATIPSESLKQAGFVPQKVDVPEELEITLPYFEDEIVHIGLK